MQRFTAILFVILLIWLMCAIYEIFVFPTFEYTGMTFDSVLLGAILPALLANAVIFVLLLSGKAIPGSYIALTLLMHILIPIYIVSPHFLKQFDHWEIYSSLFIGSCLIALASAIVLPLRIGGSARWFNILLYSSLAVAAIGILISSEYIIPNFSEIYFLRDGKAIDLFARYIQLAFVSTIGPIIIITSIIRKSYIMFIFSIILYASAYGISFEKTVILAPAWVIYVSILSCVLDIRRISNQIFLVMLPFLATAFYIVVINPDSYTLLGLVPHRMFYLPGQIFAHYVDFFSTHEHTHFSHVSVISRFIEYPYDKGIPLVIGEMYPGGNQNANFWTQDAIAGAGPSAIIPISIIFGMQLIVMNTACSGLSPRFCLPAMSVIAINYINATIFTSLISGGVLLAIILMALAPREEFGERVPANDPGRTE